MGRSNGYRPKAAVRTEVLALRARLAKLTDDEWVKAGMLMDHITTLLGHRGGPMGGKIEPRACRYCHYYGHTRQWCKKRVVDEQARDEREADIMLQEDAALRARYADAPKERPVYDPRQSYQVKLFDKLGIPYRIDPDLGPMITLQPVPPSVPLGPL